MRVRACVCVRAGEKERDCFQNNHVFLSREIGPASLATKAKVEVVDFMCLFLEIKFFLIFPGSVFLLSAVAALSYPS